MTIEEILERMPEVEGAGKEYKETAVRVGTFLEESAKHLDRTLGDLERAMAEEINSRLAQGDLPPLDEKSTHTVVEHFKNRDKKLPAYLQHVLTSVLSKHESELGFKLFEADDKTLAAATYTGFVEPEEFRQRLAQGMQFKDPTVPGGHGEFTHRIQWYLITRALEAPPGGWVEFYKWIGTVKHTKLAEDDKAKWIDLGLWDVLVDRNQSGWDNKNGPYNTETDSDFRSPENLHQCILQKLPESCPLLTSFMARRELKRNASGIRLRESAVREYVAKKVFGTAYGSLYDDDKAVVDEALKTKLFVPSMKREPRDFKAVVGEKANAAIQTVKGFFHY